ncbi:MAG: hypothetical protein NVS2B7_26500 [Herpetosiphon sp.]
MLKVRGQRPHAARLPLQRRGTRLLVGSRSAVILERRTVQLLYATVEKVNGRLRSRELYRVLRLLEQALGHAPQS